MNNIYSQYVGYAYYDPSTLSPSPEWNLEFTSPQILIVTQPVLTINSSPQGHQGKGELKLIVWSV